MLYLFWFENQSSILNGLTIIIIFDNYRFQHCTNYLSQSVSTTGVGCFVNLFCRLELVATLTWVNCSTLINAFQTYIVLGVVKSMGGEEKVVKALPVKTAQQVSG